MSGKDKNNKPLKKKAWKKNNDQFYSGNDMPPRRNIDDAATRRQVTEEVNFFWAEKKEMILEKGRAEYAKILNKDGPEGLKSFKGGDLMDWDEYRDALTEQNKELHEVEKMYTAHKLEIRKQSLVSENSGNADVGINHEDMFSLFERYGVPVELMNEIEMDIRKAGPKEVKIENSELPKLSNLKMLIKMAESNEPIKPKGNPISVKDMVTKINSMAKSSEGGSGTTTRIKNTKAGSSAKIKAIAKKFGGSQGTPSNRSFRKMGR